MKQLPLYSPPFVQAEKGFREWLDILGYAPTTVYNLPNAIREFLHYMEQQAYFLLIDIAPQTIQEYYEYLKTRPNITQGGGLSNAYLNKHQQAIKRFIVFLRQVKKVSFPEVGFHTEGKDENMIDVLTLEEIKQLLAALQLPRTFCNKAFGYSDSLKWHWRVKEW